jgi:hypothetical protein
MKMVVGEFVDSGFERTLMVVKAVQLKSRSWMAFAPHHLLQ